MNISYFSLYLSLSLAFWGFLLLNAHKISAKLNYKYGKKSLATELDHYDSWQRLGTFFPPLPHGQDCALDIEISAYKVRVKFKASYSILLHKVRIVSWGMGCSVSCLDRFGASDRRREEGQAVGGSTDTCDWWGFKFIEWVWSEFQKCV